MRKDLFTSLTFVFLLAGCSNQSLFSMALTLMAFF